MGISPGARRLAISALGFALIVFTAAGRPAPSQSSVVIFFDAHLISTEPDMVLAEAVAVIGEERIILRFSTR